MQQEISSAQKQILEEVIQSLPVYDDLCKHLCDIIPHILEQKGISRELYSITSRVKDIVSIENKITKKGSKYNKIDDLTDICGIRIITYILDDKERIAQYLRSVFSIDEKNSINKQDSLATDKVGYRSIHIIAELGKERTSLVECKKYQGKKFEIQIRTCLEHAWAEIEHDRGYKFNGGALSDKYKRRFSLLAGVLEMADTEFNSLCSDIDLNIKTESENPSPNLVQLVAVDHNSEINEGNFFTILPSNHPQNIPLRKFNERLRECFQWDILFEEIKAFGITSSLDFYEICTWPPFTDNVNKFRASLMIQEQKAIAEAATKGEGMLSYILSARSEFSTLLFDEDNNYYYELALSFYDLERYYSTSWQAIEKYRTLSNNKICRIYFDFLKVRYKHENILEVFSKNGITIHDPTKNRTVAVQVKKKSASKNDGLKDIDKPSLYILKDPPTDS